MKELRIIKIGGNVIDDPLKLKNFLEEFSALEGQKILVHGGGREATRLSARLGLETRMIEGRRVTDRDTIDVVTMVYAGLVNKRIVAKLQALDCNAIGLCGADADVIKATMRGKTPVDYGYVGDIEPSDITTSFISMLVNAGITPVFCAINHDREGHLLNCNADSVASALAIACSVDAEVDLIFCFEKDGVLSDVDDPNSLIPLINSANYVALKESGALSGGMIPKVDNAFVAVRNGVRSVEIRSAESLGNKRGTVVIK